MPLVWWIVLGAADLIGRSTWQKAALWPFYVVFWAVGVVLIAVAVITLIIGTMIIRVTVPDLTAEQIQRWGEVQICMNAQQQAEGKQEDTDGQCNQADS